MHILKELDELVEAGVISQDTADAISKYYQAKKQRSTNPLLITFGILGALLVGLGTILIIAHNWAEFTKTVRTILAFVPLVLGQILCAFILIKKQTSVAWREGGSAFLFLAIAACISLISQIYHIPGNLSTFLLTWMPVGLPLVYIMRSSVTSLMYVIGITVYVVIADYWLFSSSEPLFFWLLLLGILPYYYWLYRQQPHSNFMSFHNWLIPLALTIALGTVIQEKGHLLLVGYSSLFSLFVLLGNTPYLNPKRLSQNGYKVLGIAGASIYLIILSFDWYWQDLRTLDISLFATIDSAELIAAVLPALLAAYLLYSKRLPKSLFAINPFEWLFLLFIPIFIIGAFSGLSVVLINLLTLAFALLVIRKGAVKNNLGQLNFGLLIIIALLIGRFLDMDISFLARGILFILLGIGFFITNFWMMKNRKTNE